MTTFATQVLKNMAHMVAVFVAVVTLGMYAEIEDGKQSAVRPGLSETDQRELCQKNDGIRAECS